LGGYHWKEANAFTTYLVDPFQKANTDEKIPKNMRIQSFWGYYTLIGEIPSINAVHMYNIDATDVRDLTKAEMEGRKFALWALKALQCPGDYLFLVLLCHLEFKVAFAYRTRQYFHKVFFR
jgi:hypothetical protein